MRPGVLAAVVAACVLEGGAAWSACLPGQSRNCLDLDVSQLSGQIVAGERPAAPTSGVPSAEPAPAYSGPTVGLSKTVRQTPTVGYRWSLD